MICFRFSMLSVTGQLRMEFYRCRRNAQSWFQFSSVADLIQQIHSILDRLLMCLSCLKLLKRLLLISSLCISRQISCFLSANPVFEGVTPLRRFYSISFLIFTGLSIVLNSPYWHCSMLVPLSTLLTTKSCLNGSKFRLACLATFLVGWAHFSVSAPFVWSMGPLDPHGSLPPMVFLRVRSCVLFFTSFTPPR